MGREREEMVKQDGTVGGIAVLKSLLAGEDGLDEAAIKAVQGWKFKPGRNRGKPFDTDIIIPVEFSLSEQK